MGWRLRCFADQEITRMLNPKEILQRTYNDVVKSHASVDEHSYADQKITDLSPEAQRIVKKLAKLDYERRQLKAQLAAIAPYHEVSFQGQTCGGDAVMVIKLQGKSPELTAIRKTATAARAAIYKRYMEASTAIIGARGKELRELVEKAVADLRAMAKQ
jgi:hypothetical protein